VSATPPVPELASPAVLGQALRTSGYFAVKTPLLLDREALHAVFASHRYFSSPASDREKDVTQFFRDGRFVVDPWLAKDGQSIGDFLPANLNATMLAIGAELEKQLRAALPEENVRFETVVARWRNPAIEASPFSAEHADGWFPHRDLGAVWLNVSLTLYGDGTVYWESGTTPRDAPGRSTAPGELFILTGGGRERALGVPATWHSAPHTGFDSERLLLLFYFGPAERDRTP
jgi:hypothetical protein